MSIILKGIDKPSDCDYCDLEDHGYCRALGSYIDVEEGIDTRCPIEEIVCCAECKYYSGKYCLNIKALMPKAPSPDDYCSYGEKESE